MTVLVVDDHAPSRSHIARFLTTRGYEVSEAGNGEEALACFEQQKIELVLLDIRMPGMDGRQVATLMKAISPDVHTPIIFVTALDSEEIHATAIEAGGDDFITKPVNHEILEAKIRAHLRIRELNAQLAERNKALASYNRQLVREHDLVRHFFDHALGQSFLDPSYIRYHVSAVSAFNGDVFLAERGPRGHVYVLLGDFTGHGLGAAMGTLPVAQAFFGTVRAGYVAGDVAREINSQLTALLPVDMFLAATLVEIYPGGNRIGVWSGGMPEMYLIRNGDAIAITSKHMPLGILEDTEFDPTVSFYTLEANDKLFLYTDGVIEARNGAGEEFGENRLRSSLGKRSKNLVETVNSALQDHLGNSRQTDDLSLVEVACDRVPQKLLSTPQATVSGLRPLPLSLESTLTCREIRESDPVSQIVSAITQNPHVHARRDVVYSVLAELFNNAVDYGLLDMGSIQKGGNVDFAEFYRQRQQRLAAASDGWVRIAAAIETDGGALRLVLGVEQSRNGIDPNRVQQMNETDDLGGRGLVIARSLCSSLEFDCEGRRVVATIPL